MKRFFSGIQATGNLHIGNYLGAVKPWVDYQSEGETIYFVPDLHSLNVRPEPELLRQETLANVAWMVAAGMDTDKTVLFVQSAVPAHAELCWILNNYVTMGELSRQTQYKDKSAKRGSDGQIAALFTYPVLMAADILLYSPTHVPTGEDQKQHVELARDIAERFNNIYGETFVMPEPLVREIGARIMSLQSPENKMSKSDDQQGGNVLLLDSEDVIRSKFQRAVTDSGSTIEVSDDKPAITNLLQIYAAFSDKTVPEVESEFAGKGYGDFKQTLGNLVVKNLVPVQQKYNELMNNQDKLMAIIDSGNKKAQNIAGKKLSEVKKKIGLL